MHPSCALIVWLATVLGVQFVAYGGLLALVAGALLLAPAMFGRWRAYVWRARWLLLVLWLILAYNTPGEAVHDLPWAPTFEGVAEANLQAARLIAMLACLAWLFQRLGHEGMIAGLWGLSQPMRVLGVESERLVVRLALVLENMQEAPEKGAWKRMLAAHLPVADGKEVLHLTLAPWRLGDTLVVLASGLGLMGAALL